MIGLIQRVTDARVEVNDLVIGEIQQGTLAFIAIEPSDTINESKRLIDRIIHYRIFEDNQGKTNLSLLDIKGGLLLVPQFTLGADTKKGNRPSFSSVASPKDAENAFNDCVTYAKTIYHSVEQGQFGADMKVHLCNDGPMTFWLQVTAK